MKRAIYLSLSFLVVFTIVIIAEAKPKPVKITDLKIGSKLPYEVGPALEKGTKYYIDRDYTVVEMPKELVGIQFIMTANNDKKSTGDGFVTFKVNKPSIIWICRDSRGDEEKGGKPPEWMEKDYEKQLDGKDPLVIEVTDGGMGTFTLWKAEVKAGKVAIGGNADKPATGQGSNYLILVEENQSASVDPAAKLTTTWSTIKSQ